MKKLIVVMASLLLLWGCGDKATKTTSTENGVKLPSNLFVTQKHEGAISVLEARKLKPGDKVIVSGKVMGKDKVFNDNRAFMIIGDPSTLTSCDLRPDDECKKPWDVCCDSDEQIKNGTLSIQVVDDKGRPLKVGLKGQGGLNKLSKVTIEGIVSADSNDQVMTINAASISVK